MDRLLNATMMMLIGTALLAAGCGDDDNGNGNGTPTADTPMQALKNFQAAMLAGDKDAVANCIDGSDKHIEFFADTCEMIAVTTRFQDAMKAAYGEDAVKGGGEKNPFADENFLKGVEIKIDGDTAVATKPGDDEKIKLVKKNGQWKLDANAMMPEEEFEQAAMAMAMMKAMAEAQKGLMDKIDQPGYSAERINKELGQAMGKAMGFPMPTPPTPTPPMPMPMPMPK